MRQRLYSIGADGLVKLAPKMYDDVPLKTEDISEEEKAIVDFCLDCKHPKCKGNCRELTRFRKELKKNGKQV